MTTIDLLEETKFKNDPRLKGVLTINDLKEINKRINGRLREIFTPNYIERISKGLPRKIKLMKMPKKDIKTSHAQVMNPPDPKQDFDTTTTLGKIK